MVRRLRTDLLRIEWYVKPSFNLSISHVRRRAAPRRTARHRITPHIDAFTRMRYRHKRAVKAVFHDTDTDTACRATSPFRLPQE